MKRYDLDSDAGSCVVERQDGEYILYADHVEAMKRIAGSYPAQPFAVVIDRTYEGEGPTLAVWNGENFSFSDGDCFEREADGTLDGYNAEWLTHHQLEKRLFRVSALPSALTLTDDQIADAIPISSLVLKGERNGVLMNLDELREFARAVLATSAADAEEDAYVIDRLGKLLAGVAIVLKGPDLAQHRHSYHDLVEVAEKMVIELDLYRATYGDKMPAEASAVPAALTGDDHE